MAYKEEPIPSPSDVPTHFAVSGNLDRHVCRGAVTLDIVDCDLAAVVQHSTHSADGCFDLMFSRADTLHVGQGCHQTNRSVTAHAKVSDIVKEDDPGGARGIDRVTKQSPYYHVRPTRLVDRGGAEMVVLAAEALQSVG